MGLSLDFILFISLILLYSAWIIIAYTLLLSLIKMSKGENLHGNSQVTDYFIITVRYKM